MKSHPVFLKNTDTLTDLTLSLQALVLSVARYAIERRGGLVKTNPETFALGCTGLSPSDHKTCQQEVETLCSSLETSTIFHLYEPARNVSLS